MLYILSVVAISAAVARRWARWETAAAWLGIFLAGWAIIHFGLDVEVKQGFFFSAAASLAGYFLTDMASGFGCMLSNARTVLFAIVIVAFLSLAKLHNSNPQLAEFITGWTIFFGIIAFIFRKRPEKKKTS